jgi:hypothetical protein
MPAPDARPGGRLARLLPALDWLGHYRRAWLRGDAVAALTTWALVVPQAIAYAQITQLPPQAGGRVPDTSAYVALENEPAARTDSGLLVFRLNAPLRRSGLADDIGEAHIYRTIADATPDVRAALSS